MSNIRNKEEFFSSIWEWDFLNDCFGETKIRVTDIDGSVERYSHQLILETKRPNVPIPEGQLIKFINLNRTGLTTVIAIWGNANNPEQMQCFYPSPFPATKVISVFDGVDIKNYVHKWFLYANSNKWDEVALRAISKSKRWQSDTELRLERWRKTGRVFY